MQELKEIDCRLDMSQLIDTMAAEDRISRLSAEEIKDAIRYLNGNQLFVVYLRWIEGYKTKRAMAERLGISEQAVGKIVNKKLAGLKAKLLFMAELSNIDRRSMGLDNWDRVKDEADPGDGDYWSGTSDEMNAKKDVRSRWAQREIEERKAQLNDIVWGHNPDDEGPAFSKNPGYSVMKHNARPWRPSSWEGQTNPTVEPTTKSHDDQHADAMKARWAEQKAERIEQRRAARIAAQEIRSKLDESPGKIERRKAAEEIKRNFGQSGLVSGNFQPY